MMEMELILVTSEYIKTLVELGLKLVMISTVKLIDLSGTVNLNSSGNVVAIGAYLNDGNGVDSGHVRVYQNVGGTWTKLGNDIDGDAAEDLSGGSVSINDAGNVVSIGAAGNDDGGSQARSRQSI